MRALIDWRAGCGKSACPVLREGWGSNAPSLPLFDLPANAHGLGIMLSGLIPQRSCAKLRAMKTPRLPAVKHLWLLLCLLLAALVVGSAPAQIPGLKNQAESPETAKPAAPDSPEERRTKLEQLAQEARDTLTRLDASGAVAALPEGISAAELDERRRTLEQLVLTIGRTLKTAPSSRRLAKRWKRRGPVRPLGPASKSRRPTRC